MGFASHCFCFSNKNPTKCFSTTIGLAGINILKRQLCLPSDYPTIKSMVPKDNEISPGTSILWKASTPAEGEVTSLREFSIDCIRQKTHIMITQWRPWPWLLMWHIPSLLFKLGYYFRTEKVDLRGFLYLWNLLTNVTTLDKSPSPPPAFYL